MTKPTRPSRRNHLSIVGANSIELVQNDSQERIDAELEDDLIEFVDTWLRKIRDFARTVDPNEFYSLRSANGRFGSADYPESILNSVDEMRLFALDSFDSINGRGIPTTVPGVTHTLEPVFQDFTSREISDFLAGFKEALTSVYVYSQMRELQNLAQVGVGSNSSDAQRFSLLDEDLQIEIAYQLLEDSLEIFRQMGEVGFDGSSELAARNSPALFFDVRQVTRAINYASRDRSVEGFQKAPFGLLPVVKDVEGMLADPLHATQTLIGEAEKYVLDRANKLNHPTTGLLLGTDGSELKAKLTLISNSPGVESEPTSLEAGTTTYGPPELTLIRNLQRETPGGPDSSGIA